MNDTGEAMSVEADAWETWSVQVLSAVHVPMYSRAPKGAEGSSFAYAVFTRGAETWSGVFQSSMDAAGYHLAGMMTAALLAYVKTGEVLSLRVGGEYGGNLPGIWFGKRPRIIQWIP